MAIVVDDTPSTDTDLDLCDLWLNDAANLADCQAFTWVSGTTPNIEVRAEVRALANGRLRMVSRAGRVASTTWNLTRISRPQVDWLEAHAGRLVCVRDDRGRKFYGVYLSVPVDEPNWTKARASTQLTLQQVTHSEEA